MSPRPAAPSSASATAWATASPSLCPSSPGRPSNRQPPSTSGRSGSSPKRCTSNPCPTRSSNAAHAVRSASQPRAHARSSGSVILRFHVSPGTTTTRPPRRSTSSASSVPSPPSACARRSTVGAERLRRLHGDERAAVRRLDTTPDASTTLIVSVTGIAGTAASAPARTASTTAANNALRRQRSGGVVDADDRRLVGHRRQPGAHRRAARGAAGDAALARRVGGRHDHHDAVARASRATSTATSMTRAEPSDSYCLAAPNGRRHRPDDDRPHDLAHGGRVVPCPDHAPRSRRPPGRAGRHRLLRRRRCDDARRAGRGRHRAPARARRRPLRRGRSARRPLRRHEGSHRHRHRQPDRPPGERRRPDGARRPVRRAGHARRPSALGDGPGARAVERARRAVRRRC